MAGARVVVVDPGHLLSDAGRGWLGALGSAAMRELGVSGEVRAKVVDDAEMSRAHLAYCGVPGTTDVITFDLSGDARELDADLLVCFDEARRQAGRRGIPVERELLLYVAHGVVHCMGHDDHDEADARRMHEIEDRVLAAIGVGATYAAPAREDEPASPTLARTPSTLTPGGLGETPEGSS